jgi:D-ribulokinase
MSAFFVGIDVGTASARAGVFNEAGDLVATAKRAVTLHHESGGVVEQSSGEVWAAVSSAVKEAVAKAELRPADIKGIGFDATCSLVVLGEGGTPLAVGPSGDAARDIILWMDHRAVEQAERINATGHAVLRYVGGRISPEMETPKLLWLKENRQQTFDAAWQFFDLTDFLTWKASGSLARSSCTVTCKWTYLAHESRWDADYFQAIGLKELADEAFARIGREIVEPGTALGTGLTQAAAEDLGLAPGTAVAAGLIDAHAGGVGTVGVTVGDRSDPTRCMGYVFGTSSCTMTTTHEPAFVPGIWGPYFSAMVPGAWLSEGGQSAAGAAIDHLVSFHPAAAEATALARGEGKSLPEWLADKAASSVCSLSEAARLAGAIHVVPEFLGNRAPFADPHARAIVAGLGMEKDVSSLVALYVAGLCGLGYGLRQIVEIQAANGAPVETIAISGGAGRHPLIRQILADATGLPVIATRSEEPVLLGSAMLGAVAAGAFKDVRTAMSAMSSRDAIYEPAGDGIADWHAARFEAFGKLQEAARQIATAER